MKNIKHILIVAFGAFLVNSQNIQSQILNSLEVGNSVIDVPHTLKSNKDITKTTLSSFSTHSKYNEKINGYVNITIDENGFIVKIIAPSSVNNGVLLNHYRGSAPCSHCLPYSENKDCVIECIVDIIFN